MVFVKDTSGHEVNGFWLSLVLNDIEYCWYTKPILYFTLTFFLWSGGFFVLLCDLKRVKKTRSNLEKRLIQTSSIYQISSDVFIKPLLHILNSSRYWSPVYKTVSIMGHFRITKTPYSHNNAIYIHVYTLFVQFACRTKLYKMNVFKFSSGQHVSILSL